MAAELIVPGLCLPRGAVLSHASAARVWELPLPHNYDESVHITVPRNRSRCAAVGAVVHRRDLPSADRLEVNGHQTTTALRTVLDLASLLPVADAVAAADAALHAGLVDEPELAARVTSVRGIGARECRGMLSLVDAGADSSLESLLRVAMAQAAVPAPVTQYVITSDGVFVARVDFAWPQLRLIVEADGFACHSDREAYRRDRERGNQLQRLGWRVLRFSWEAITLRPDEVVREILEALGLG